MPSGASVNHMKDNMLVDVDEINLDLVVELVRDVEQALPGPGLAHSLQTLQVWQTSGMISSTFSGTLLVHNIASSRARRATMTTRGCARVETANASRGGRRSHTQRTRAN